MLTKQIAERLKKARLYLGLSQVYIADALQITHKEVSFIENGKRKFVPNEYIFYISEHGISLNWIYGKSDIMLEDEFILDATKALLEKVTKKR